MPQVNCLHKSEDYWSLLPPLLHHCRCHLKTKKPEISKFHGDLSMITVCCNSSYLKFSADRQCYLRNFLEFYGLFLKTVAQSCTEKSKGKLKTNTVSQFPLQPYVVHTKENQYLRTLLANNRFHMTETWSHSCLKPLNI